MPRRIPFRLAAACVLAICITPLASASAKSVAGDLRVVNSAGKTLAEQTQYTGTTRIKTDRGANCFGAGTGGSGDSVTINGPTALGAVIDGSAVTPDLKPVSLTDSFSFGLGVCGFGGFEPKSSSSYWYLKVNHKAAQVGGDSLKVKPGDEVLWYLIPPSAKEAPQELALDAPAFADRGGFTVRVWSYDDAGKRKPAKGATVTGASKPTGADGRTTVSIQQVTELTATAKGLIPSDSETVCIKGIGTKLCTDDPIAGSSGADVIKGTRQTDVIRAGAGNDRIDVRDGNIDRVDCGPGKDTVLVDDSDTAKKCETRKAA